MAVFAVYIRKQTAFEGVIEDLGNTYHYETDFGDAFDDAEVINTVAEAERNITQASVTFVEGVTWGPTDGPAADNVIRERVALSGVGAADDVPEMYAENCVVAQWEISRAPVTNRRRWLRKFLRLCNFGSQAWLPAELRGDSPIPGNVATQVENYQESVRNFTTIGGSNINLVNEQGDGRAEAGSGFVNEFLSTRIIVE